MESRWRPHFGDQLASYSSKLQTGPVKNAYLLIWRDMQRLEREAIKCATLTPASIDNFQTEQIPPGAAFFCPGAIFLDIMIAFEREWRH
jgi:hypothetical protein